MMLHGKTCTLVCPPGEAPSQPVLTCNDGFVENISSVRCRLAPVRDTRPVVGGLVSGAITGGEKRTACVRAANLRCDAKPGGSSILFQMTGVTKAECDEFFEECRSYNGRFQWGEHTEGGNGTCTMGCFSELHDDDAAQALLDEAAAEAARLQALVGIFPVAKDAESRPTCNAGPICIAVSGSCNEGDDGDYYRHPLCADMMSQWVQVDGSHRVRYDGSPQYSQSGKWLLESGADPNYDKYGVELARQPVFNQLPVLGMYGWAFQCRTRVNSFTYNVQFKMLELTLGQCSCTDEQDCSGNGEAVGSKEFGPNCRCRCNEGFEGDHCEIELCRVPDVLHAAIPACAEGRWIRPGETCTPLCIASFQPTAESFLCENTLLYPSPFLCTAVPGIGEELTSVDTGIKPTDPPIPCPEFHCFDRGRPTGKRHPDGTCVCECFTNYTGLDCRQIIGSCPAPLQKSIANSAPRPCKEGSTVATTCTTQCLEGFYPIPSRLECTGRDLVPATFRCFGGQTTREAWCMSMRYISIAASSIAVLALCISCSVVLRTYTRPVKSFVVSRQLVEVEKDDEGKFKVVKPNGNPFESRMPPHIKHAVQPEIAWMPAEEPSWGAGAQYALEDRGGAAQTSGLRQLGHASPVNQYQVADVSPTNMQLAPVAAFTSERTYDGGPVVAQEPSSPSPAPSLHDGHKVVVHGLQEEQSVLNGAHGQLLGREPGSGLWLVAMEGQDGLRQLSDQNLQHAPQEPNVAHGQWLLQLYDLDSQAQAAKRAQEAQFMTKRQKAEADFLAASAAALKATAAEREEAEASMREALRLADAEMLRGAAERGRLAVEKCKGVKPSALSSLVRVLQVAESRLAQHDEREDSRRRKREYDQRVLHGQAADWKMTPAEFWRHAQEGNVERVRAGLKAKLPIFTRSQDGQRFSIVHVACKGVGVDSEETAGKRLEVVQELLKARAHANGVDAERRTPLDLAFGEDSPAEAGSEASPVMHALRDLGLRTAEEAAAEARAAADAAPRSGAATPEPAGSPAKPQPQAGRSPMVTRRFK